MFQGLSVGSPIYVLFKQEPKVSIGEVSFIGNPSPVYNTTSIMPPKYTYDVKAVIEGKEYEFNKLPGEQSVFGYQNYNTIISDSRDGIIKEVETVRNQSAQILEDIDSHKRIVEKCSTILTELNPQLKKEAEQAEEIARLKKGMSELQVGMSDIKAMLTRALNNGLKKEEK